MPFVSMCLSTHFVCLTHFHALTPVRLQSCHAISPASSLTVCYAISSLVVLSECGYWRVLDQYPTQVLLLTTRAANFSRSFLHPGFKNYAYSFIVDIQGRSCQNSSLLSTRMVLTLTTVGKATRGGPLPDEPRPMQACPR